MDTVIFDPQHALYNTANSVFLGAHFYQKWLRWVYKTDKSDKTDKIFKLLNLYLPIVETKCKTYFEYFRYNYNFLLDRPYVNEEGCLVVFKTVFQIEEELQRYGFPTGVQNMRLILPAFDLTHFYELNEKENAVRFDSI